MKVKVIDAICGQGKTTAIINMINEDKSGRRFLFIVTLLTEVERILKACKQKNFKTPSQREGKMNNIKKLFEEGANIVSTHALFGSFDESILDLAALNNYTLIMDEVTTVVDELSISKNDLKVILKEYTTIDNDGVLHWEVPEYEGKFEEFKKQIEIGGVTVHKAPNNEIIALLWLFPFCVFDAFKEIYLLTYMFDGQIQKYYYDYHKMEYEYIYVKDMHLTNEVQLYNEKPIKKLIEVCQSEKLNNIGNAQTALSASWYERNKKGKAMIQLKNNAYNYFRNVSQTPAKLNLWTTFKEYESILKGKGYSRSFAPLTTRATNDYMDRTAIEYLVNRYMQPVIKNFFIKHKITVDEDRYALSEIIQFIFRGIIRQGKPIKLYVPSRRMREILLKWINE